MVRLQIQSFQGGEVLAEGLLCDAVTASRQLVEQGLRGLAPLREVGPHGRAGLLALGLRHPSARPPHGADVRDRLLVDALRLPDHRGQLSLGLEHGALGGGGGELGLLLLHALPEVRDPGGNASCQALALLQHAQRPGEGLELRVLGRPQRTSRFPELLRQLLQGLQLLTCHTHHGVRFCPLLALDVGHPLRLLLLGKVSLRCVYLRLQALDLAVFQGDRVSDLRELGLSRLQRPLADAGQLGAPGADGLQQLRRRLVRLLDLSVQLLGELCDR
mmetsp:Transcript_120452/g.300494  ORF Transcript_120452/g.300494 Transcript_120452/m.300494 type:complete len:274 (+) Transcript_120452:1274-2095(+)